MRVLRAVLPVVLAAAMLLVGQATAGAKVDVAPALQADFAACAAKIDAAGIKIVNDIQRNGKDNKILTGGGDQVLPTDPTAVLIGAGSGGKLYWDPSETAELEKGVNAEKCAALVHEGKHLLDYNNGETPRAKCFYTGADGVQQDTRIAASEVNATYAENQYRRAVGLPPRTQYALSPLPPNNAPCEKEKPKERPPNSGCSVVAVGAPCAGSNGDPHLTTFDGFRYDQMAAGEFTLVRSQVSGLRIQARQTAFPGSRDVTLNTAVAAEVAGDRVGVYLVDGTMEVHVNAKAVQVPAAGLTLSHRGVVGTDDDAVRVDWPDGSTLEVRPIGRWGLSLIVGLAESHRGKTSGLLGNFNDDDGDDLALSDGKPLGGSGFDDLYPRFADSWRIGAQESLFDYQPGQSTQTFTDRSLPERPIVAANLPYRKSAELICRRAGVTDPAVLDGCTIDVALTGQSVFATDAAVAQRVSAAGSVALDSGGAPARTTVQGNAGQRLFVDAVRSTLPDQCGVLQLVGPDGVKLNTGCLNGGTGYIDGTVLPTSGEYAIVVAPVGSDTGRTELRTYVSTDQALDIEAGGPAVTATIMSPGALSSSNFRGSAGQKVFVTASDSTVPDQCAALQLFGPDGTRIETGCTAQGNGFLDGIELPTDGEYRIVFDPAGRDTGTVQLRLNTAVDQTGVVRINGSPATATIGQPGATSRLTFDGAAGQEVTVEATDSTLPGQCGILELRNPSGDVISRGCVVGGSGSTDPVNLPIGGRYTAVVDPAEDGVGSAKIVVRS
ncbi:MAG: VWD domain-containing protein [Mycolicibacterium cosmeticum]|nr:VWD domain-containing protein [Mycolicibacterium cosmeticum]